MQVNDQIVSPWLDEGICRYAEYLYWDEYAKEENLQYWWATDERMKAGHEQVVNAGKGNQPSDETDLTKSIYYWNQTNSSDYAKIYDKGASLLYQMQRKMGKEAFLTTLKEYVQYFAYQFVTNESFQEFWNSKGDLKDLFELYLH